MHGLRTVAAAIRTAIGEMAADIKHLNVLKCFQQGYAFSVPVRVAVEARGARGLSRHGLKMAVAPVRR